MIDENAVVEAPEPPQKTSEEIQLDIEKAQRQLGQNPNAPAVPGLNEPETLIVPDTSSDASDGTDLDKPAEKGVPSTPVPFDERTKEETEEWMKKKGFKTVEAMAESLRNLERKLHSDPTRGNQQASPVPAFRPLPTRYPGVPSPYREEVAKSYGVDPEDLDRVTAIANDVAARAIGPLRGEISRLNQELSRQSETTHLEKDPAFRDPEVLKEMHLFLEENQSLVERPGYMTIAFNQALANIGRRMVKGLGIGVSSNSIGKGPSLPSSPPGLNSGGGGVKPVTTGKTNSLQINAEKIGKLPLAEQEAYLKKMGAWSPEN
jgi:DNA-directed RNA polymerase subunit H (RpoH/RPB5)